MIFLYKLMLYYKINIYDSDGEFVAKGNLQSCFSEAKHYSDDIFFGHNLLIYTNGEYSLLQNYDNEEIMKQDRQRIQNAIKARQSEIHLSEDIDEDD